MNTDSNTPTNDVPSTLPRLVGFSLPALGLNTLVTAVFVFLPALYAEHFHLGAAEVGTIFLLAKFVDMIAAPTWGLFMDSYRTRWGRRRPWLVLSTPILMLAIFMVYNPPESVSALYLFTWLCTLYFGWSAWTISHTSWALELSRDYDRRSRITGARRAPSGRAFTGNTVQYSRIRGGAYRQPHRRRCRRRTLSRPN